MLLRNPSPLPRTLWGETWRLLLALAFGGFILGAVLIESQQPGEPPVPESLAFIEVVLGIVALALLPLRRRYPMPVAAVTAVLSGFSALATGASLIAMISLATHRRWRPVALVAALSMAASASYEAVRPTGNGLWGNVLSLVIGTLIVALTIAIGYYIGTRRDLFASWQQRAETAEREQASRVAEARATERALIAREMHDVLAHRISLVAMHSGALAYRTDLSADDTTRTAEVIRDNAHLALTELREVLGVLRDPAAPRDGEAIEPPQPTLASVEALIADERESGRTVSADIDVADLDSAPNALSRNAFRIVQECLTNARKHAPGVPVRLEIRGGPDAGLEIRVSNPVPVGAALPTGLPRSGMGLAGVTERAVLAGGELTFGTDRRGEFVVRARLPWRA
ncbi:sensor histidine kinase [Pedococcus dokdonensis]|uniref:sensor histidine kinase n=1 Tax=Pedococcus dokdonensis TaxID=443156 RepID=UPI0012FE0206|nr:histidine kinase [Pedococcus dokdonensis]